MARQKRLTEKQLMALELLTCGKGMKLKDIAETVGVNQKTLWDWRNEPGFTHFQEALKKLNDERWLATVDIARSAAQQLCEDGNQRMVEFVLKNEGYNPTNKIEAEVSNNIIINIGEDEE